MQGTIRSTTKSRSIRTRAPRVLVICKKPTYGSYFLGSGSARARALVDSGDPAFSRVARAHDEHLASIEAAKRALKKLGARAVFRYRSDPPADAAFDLVVALGGDGTLLQASHMVGSDSPVVAINSAPIGSTGHFCAGANDEVSAVLEAALAGKLKKTRLARMRVEVDGELFSDRVLNDALFCHRYPAVSVRYLIRLGDRQEEQKSSGVWVGPAAGSTAAQRSAGGRILPHSSRRIQFVVREPFRAGKKELRMTRGLFGPDERLVIRSQMRDGRLYLDGPRPVRTVDFGSEVSMGLSDQPLLLLGFDSG